MPAVEPPRRSPIGLADSVVVATCCWASGRVPPTAGAERSM